MTQRRKIFNSLKLKVSSIEDPSVRSEIQEKFYHLEFLRQQSVSQFRASAIAERKAKIAQAEAEIGLVQLLEFTGDYLDKVKTEQVWMVYMENNELVFECPFTEKDMRNQLALSKAQLEHTAKEVQTDNPDINFYEGNDENEPEEK